MSMRSLSFPWLASYVFYPLMGDGNYVNGLQITHWVGENVDNTMIGMFLLGFTIPFNITQSDDVLAFH